MCTHTHTQSGHCHTWEHKKAGATQIHLLTTTPFSSQQWLPAGTRGRNPGAVCGLPDLPPVQPTGHLTVAKEAFEIYPWPSGVNTSYHSHLTWTQLPPHAAPSPLTSQLGAWDTKPAGGLGYTLGYTERPPTALPAFKLLRNAQPKIHPPGHWPAPSPAAPLL